MKIPAELLTTFNKVYGDVSFSVYLAPARINLIGEHTDYNGGYVLPATLANFGVFLAIRLHSKAEVTFRSMNAEEVYTVSLTETLQPFEKGTWANYPLGVLHAFIQEHSTISGMELLFYGNIPQGAGLSSSAALSMVTALAINELQELKLERLDLVKIAQQAEHEFAGVNCGIMDQFAIGFGKKDQAILLKCDTLDWKYIPMNLQDYELVISNTNYPRKLTDSKYNERRTECETAVKQLKPTYDLDYLGELPIAERNEALALLHDETIHKRARHFFEESHRVMISRIALINDDLKVFGRLMNASHESLRKDYEVTGKALDTLVEAANLVDGVAGSRMTGAGFGGCTISLVKKEVVTTFIEKVGEHYQKEMGLQASFYTAAIGDGARFLAQISSKTNASA